MAAAGQTPGEHEGVREVINDLWLLIRDYAKQETIDPIKMLGSFLGWGLAGSAIGTVAVQSGADAIVVSNHGGRQLDGAPSSISALPAIVAAVGSQIEVWMDGGIRSGQDVLKAWALGARGTMIGRAMAYSLGAAGEAGVTKALQILHKELDVTMAFCGHTNIQTVDRNILLPGTLPG